MKHTGGVYKKRANSKNWTIDYYDQFGKRCRLSSGQTSKREALKVRAKLLTEVAEGRHFTPVTARKLVVSELEELVRLNYEAKGQRSFGRAARAYKSLSKKIGDLIVAKLTMGQIERYRSVRLGEGISYATVHYELSLLKRGCKLALQSGYIGIMPVFPEMPAPRNAKDGFYSEGDLAALTLELPEPLRGLAQFAYRTGWRKEEMFGLRWEFVDWQAKIVRLSVALSKNKHARTFPFSTYPALEDILKTQQEYTQLWEERTANSIPWVFHRKGKPLTDVYQAWRVACKRAGLEGKTLHDFRRTAVRNLERAGVPRSVAMKLTGHKTESVYRRYDIVDEQDLADGVAKLSRAFGPQTVPTDQEKALSGVATDTP